MGKASKRKHSSDRDKRQDARITARLERQRQADAALIERRHAERIDDLNDLSLTESERLDVLLDDRGPIPEDVRSDIRRFGAELERHGWTLDGVDVDNVMWSAPWPEGAADSGDVGADDDGPFPASAMVDLLYDPLRFSVSMPSPGEAEENGTQAGEDPTRYFNDIDQAVLAAELVRGLPLSADPVWDRTPGALSADEADRRWGGPTYEPAVRQLIIPPSY